MVLRTTLTGLMLTLLAALVGGRACQAQSGTRGNYVAPARRDLPVQMVVRLPATAVLEIEGTKTQQTGETRLFTSPPLPPGRQFSYTFKATWIDNGQPVVRQRVVPVRAGQEVVVDFLQGPNDAVKKGPAQ